MTLSGKQQGVTLIVGLIMLILITLVTVLSFNVANSHLRVVNNVQIQTELQAAANTAIERTISTTGFAVPAGYTATESISQFESSASGTTAQKTPVSVGIVAACEKARILSNKESSSVSLNCLWDPDSGGTYVDGVTSASSESLCAESLWDVKASATSPQDSNATMEVHEGVGIKTSRTSLPSGCGV